MGQIIDVRIYIHYRITQAPWGGGNSFLKAFAKACRDRGVELARSLNADYDILFFNAAHSAPGRHLDLQELVQQKYGGRSGPLKHLVRRGRRRTLVYRLDGFRCVYGGKKDDQSDCIQRCCSQLADHIIFQSKMSLDWARSPDIGYARQCHSLIYNGIDQGLFRPKETGFWDGGRPLKVFSANWSSNANKGYRELVELAELSGVTVTFCGNWPLGNISPGKVRVLKAMTQEALAGELIKHDVFFHASKYDTCSNACLEALSCGLPIIYHSTSGISEMAGECGVPLNPADLSETLENMRKGFLSMRKALEEKRAFFSMDRCASEYLDLFKDLLR